MVRSGAGPVLKKMEAACAPPLQAQLDVLHLHCQDTTGWMAPALAMHSIVTGAGCDRGKLLCTHRVDGPKRPTRAAGVPESSSLIVWPRFI